jgi:hypothetical protein
MKRATVTYQRGPNCLCVMLGSYTMILSSREDEKPVLTKVESIARALTASQNVSIVHGMVFLT